MSIKEDNILIAKFMGYKCKYSKITECYRIYTPTNRLASPYVSYTGEEESWNLMSFSYHKDWNKLMEVINKLEKKAITVLKYNDCDGCVRPYFFEIKSKTGRESTACYSKTKIGAVYSTVVGYIKFLSSIL